MIWCFGVGCVVPFHSVFCYTWLTWMTEPGMPMLFLNPGPNWPYLQQMLYSVPGFCLSFLSLTCTFTFLFSTVFFHLWHFVYWPAEFSSFLPFFFYLPFFQLVMHTCYCHGMAPCGLPFFLSCIHFVTNNAGVPSAAVLMSFSFYWTLWIWLLKTVHGTSPPLLGSCAVQAFTFSLPSLKFASFHLL